MINDHPHSARPDQDSLTLRGTRRRHIPQRMCCICRSRLPKSNLYRYVCQRTGQDRPALEYDPQQILPGRGFYVCSDPGCQRALTRHKGWQKKCRGES
ncbi:MAG: DUF448 domain-containing protein [Desulfovermiculus sp.]